MSSEDLEASISGATLASLLSGLPRLAPPPLPQTAANIHATHSQQSHPFHSTGGFRAGGGRSPGKSPNPPLGDAEGLLLGRFATSSRPAIHDLGSDASGTSGNAIGPSQSWANPERGDQDVVQELSISRHWEAAETGPHGHRLRLFDGAGAVQPDVITSCLSALSDQPPPFESTGGASSSTGGGSGSSIPVRDPSIRDLDHVVGWFVRRSAAPLRPSMRETAGTVSLHRWLSRKAQELTEQLGYPPETALRRWQGRPFLLMLLCPSGVAASTTVQTCSYRVFVFEPGRQGSSAGTGSGVSSHPGTSGRTSSPVLRPLRLQILNLGSIPRPQYSSFAPPPIVPAGLSFLGRSSPPSGLHEGQRRVTRDPTSEASEASSSVMGLLSKQGRHQVELLEEAYQEQMKQLQHLAQQMAALQAVGRSF